MLELIRPCCGIMRALPDVKIGDSFDLGPCIKCGATFRGKRTKNGVMEAL